MKRFGIIGCPLGQSKSAAYFTEKFRNENIDAEFKLYELPSIDDLSSLPEDIAGFSVTIPYKQAIIPLLDEVSPEAKAIGAVNCVRCRNDRRSGFNTDVVGIRHTLGLLTGGEDVGQALVLGTGGASAAVQYALAERGIPFAIVSRDPNRGNFTYGDITAELIKECRLIINATPVGMFPDEEAAPELPYAALDERHLLFDLIYNPAQTRFLRYGAEAGAQTVNGYPLFIAQAEEAWRIWNE